MTLDEAQRKTVTEWIQAGMKLSEIQNRLISDLNLRLTYMEVRMLVDDLKLVPKDPEPAVTSAGPLGDPKGTTPAKPAQLAREEAPVPPAAGVAVTVDQITRPGALVSGKVSFSDGKSADWYLDQTGRLGLVPKEPGYRPPASDVQQFQMALEKELSKIGF